MDLIIRNARTPDRPGRVDLAIRAGRIAQIAPRVAASGGQEIDVGGQLVIPGLVESHFHLDKALLGAGAPADAGTVAGAIRTSAEMKRRFTRCARTWRSIRSSASWGWRRSFRCSASTRGRSTCRSACSRRKASSSRPAPSVCCARR